MDTHSKTPTATKENNKMDKCPEEIKSKTMSQPKLRSNIPKPVPYVRVPREKRSRSCTSSCFKTSTPTVCTPNSLKLRSLSQITPFSESKTTERKKSAQTGSVRSQPLSITRSLYSNVKAKIDNKTPVSLLRKSQIRLSEDCLMQSDNLSENRSIVSHQVDDSRVNSLIDGRDEDHSLVDKGRQDSSLVDKGRQDSSLIDKGRQESFFIVKGRQNSSLVDDSGSDNPAFEGKCKAVVEKTTDGKISTTNSSNFDMQFSQNDSESPQKQPLTAYSESDSDHSFLNMQIPEDQVNVSKEEDIFKHIEKTKKYFLKECAPEFLASFEKQMEEISEMWLQLICDLIETKMTIGKSASLKLSLHNPKLSLNVVVTKFFQNLPTQGELLNRKLCKIEEEQMNILRVMIHNIVALIKEYDELKGNNCQMKETYEQTQSRLKEELAILGQENKELDQKFMSAIEKYEIEKAKTEELEEQQVEVLKKILELRKIIKNVEGKCIELEIRGENIDANRLKLEECVRNLETVREKESKKTDGLLKKYAESENVINKLKQEINKNNNSKKSMEEKIKGLEDKINELKAALENSLVKRTELENEVSDKSKKMEEFEAKISLLKSNKKKSQEDKVKEDSNLELVKDLVNDVEKRNMQIKELKKKINRLEHMLMEKSTSEEKLLSHVTKLNKKCYNNCTSLTNQISDLQKAARGLQGQVSELEKVLGQKTLELDQRDRLIKELKLLIQLKNEAEPSKCSSRKHHRAEKLMSAETDKETLCRHKKMIEMFSLLELKQMEIIKMERRILGLQKFGNCEEKTRKEQKQQTKRNDGAVD